MRKALHLIIYSVLSCKILLSPSISLHAQESFADRYNATYLSTHNGLPHNFIDDIYKDSRGFLWIATGGGGLSRYDGYEFLAFSPNIPQRKLKSNFIRKVCEDRFHRMWIVSEGGTDIIDLNTLTSGIPPALSPQLTAIADLPASHITTDSQGCIWICCGQQLHRIEFTSDGNIRNIHALTHPGLQKGEQVFKDVEQDGHIWMVLDGVVHKIAYSNGWQVHPVADCLHFPSDTQVTDFIDKENEIWIATNIGLVRYNQNSHTAKLYEHIPGNPYSLSQNFLTGLAVSDDKQLIATSLRGINIYDPIKDHFEHIQADMPNDGTRLNSDFINCIAVENGHLWIGTENKGINKLSPKRLSVLNYAYDKNDPYNLPHHPVNAIYEDSKGILWIGCVEGGLHYKEPDSKRFLPYTYEDNILPHNSVSAITSTPDGTLWVGTWGGGICLLNPHQSRQPLEIISSSGEGQFPVNFIGTLIADTLNNGVWIGANQGLFFYDLTRRRLCIPLADNASTNIRGYIGSAIDREGILWIGSMEGVYAIDLHSCRKDEAGATFDYRHLKYKLDDPDSRLIEKITCISLSHDGTLWIGTNGNGFYHRETDAAGKERFISHTTAHGLCNNSIRNILEDKNGDLWIATDNGLSRMKMPEQQFTNFTIHDGLNDMQFYWNAACRPANGDLLFGTMTGLTVIDHNYPAIQPLPDTPLYFTRLRINNEEVLPGSKRLPTDIAIIPAISIHEREQSFSLEFAALDFESDHAATYSYRLLGFNDHWIQLPTSQRFASYTNLSPGHYTFEVKYDNGTDSPRIVSLPIDIEPSFYKTSWFILLVTLLCAVGIWQFWQWRIRKLKRQKEELFRQVEKRTRELQAQKQLLEERTNELSRQNELLTEQNEKITQQKKQLAQMAHKVQELTLDKISFFTNITHEFRTPLTLIIGPIERALKLSYNPQVIEQLHFVERNSKYLLLLVNQLMDFRKVESGKLEIMRTRRNFLKFADELTAPFAAFAHERNIELRTYYRMAEPESIYDEDAMFKVLSNLLSNALKFTPNGGRVSLYVCQLAATANREETLYISVRDSGSGIPEEDLQKIFNRFYQSKNQMKYPMYGQSGSGIGLYLCKRIMQAQNGEITVRNNRRTCGCSFRLFLPLPKEETQMPSPHPSTAPASSLPGQTDLPPKGLRILVVEDNSDMRSYIRSILRERYEVAEAKDGAEALKILESQSIDFIISDLMMPVMDGMELSHRVKENFALSHIPFLMLTAKTSQEARIESYHIGVDAYLMKPFDESLLLARIENILENRKRCQQRFSIAMNVDELRIDEECSDKKFMNRVMEIMQQNYKNSYFDVSDFCEAAGVSKTLLNNKLQNLTGHSPAIFIRNYRLNMAHELIRKSRNDKNISISEIAYKVGFNDPKYFARCFMKLFNMRPSDLRNEQE